MCALLDRAELTQALDVIWQRVRRLNRYVEERAPWTLAKDEQRAGDLDGVLASLAEGVRVVSLLLVPYLPASTERLLDALGAEDRYARRCALRGGGSGGPSLRGSLSRGSPRR